MDNALSPQCIRDVDAVLAMDRKDIGPSTFWVMILDALKKHDVAYEKAQRCEEIFVHPKNRAGLGLNQYEVHRNTGMIKRVGADGSKLAGATAFEMSAIPISIVM